jgi:proline iminopeptidase
LLPNYQTITTDEQKQHALTIATIEAHYFMNEVIPSDKSILKNVDKFRHVPAIIVNGRYDIICPIETAYLLHQP